MSSCSLSRGARALLLETPVLRRVPNDITDQWRHQ